MIEAVQTKREQIKAKFEQVSSQISQLQEEQTKLQGAYSVLGELIDEQESKDKESE